MNLNNSSFCSRLASLKVSQWVTETQHTPSQSPSWKNGTQPSVQVTGVTKRKWILLIFCSAINQKQPVDQHTG